MERRSAHPVAKYAPSSLKARRLSALHPDNQVRAYLRRFLCSGPGFRVQRSRSGGLSRFLPCGQAALGGPTTRSIPALASSSQNARSGVRPESRGLPGAGLRAPPAGAALPASGFPLTGRRGGPVLRPPDPPWPHHRNVSRRRPLTEPSGRNIGIGMWSGQGGDVSVMAGLAWLK